MARSDEKSWSLRSVLLIIYSLAVSAFLLLTQWNMTVVGIFLIFFNSMIAPGAFAGIAAKRYGIRLDDKGKALSGWFANTSAVITLLILFSSYNQVAEYLTLEEIAVLYVFYILTVFVVRLIVIFIFNMYLGRFNSERTENKSLDDVV